jgi:hypothetical protein
LLKDSAVEIYVQAGREKIERGFREAEIGWLNMFLIISR